MIIIKDNDTIFYLLTKIFYHLKKIRQFSNITKLS